MNPLHIVWRTENPAMQGYFGRHCADAWAGHDWPSLMYHCWLPGDEDRPPRHARSEPLMLTAGGVDGVY
jgi:hypothetical protein